MKPLFRISALTSILHTYTCSYFFPCLCFSLTPVQYREIYTNYKGTNFNLNPNFVLEPMPGLTTGPKAAAALSMRALGFHQSILDGSLAVFETRGKALCMRQVCNNVYDTHVLVLSS